MTEITAPPAHGSVRRAVGIVLLIVAALTTVPAAVAGIAEATLIPDRAPPEAFLLPGLAAWLMTYTWWFHAALIVIGMILVFEAPRRTWAALLGVAVSVSWVVAMVFLITSGMLFPQGA
ncbi:MAG: hypothetical protein JF592_14205 [Microbacterium sp.]|uniref:hypothetical protein n=1 Tax=Microbacterium sp. TaxID=51671 RepID=UPI001DA7C6C8|nr:hypothetical protein [Microbacterium sp.]MBW8763712.1 hypothetical protein [Microbacterium sp.]